MRALIGGRSSLEYSFGQFWRASSASQTTLIELFGAQFDSKHHFQWNKIKISFIKMKTSWLKMKPFKWFCARIDNIRCCHSFAQFSNQSHHRKCSIVWPMHKYLVFGFILFLLCSHFSFSLSHTFYDHQFTWYWLDRDILLPFCVYTFFYSFVTSCDYQFQLF